eukprot:gene15957-22090_t
MGPMKMEVMEMDAKMEVMEMDAKMEVMEMDAKMEVVEMDAKMEVMERELVQAQIRVVNNDKERSMAEFELREALDKERKKFTSFAEEGKREAGVQKARAEAWYRDMEREKKAVIELKAELESVKQEEEKNHFDAFKHETLMESLRKEVEEVEAFSNEELRRFRAESMLTQKRLEKQVESLQRECTEGAAEIDRLRRGETLPLMQSSNRMLQDDLMQLRRLAISMPTGDFLRGEMSPGNSMRTQLKPITSPHRSSANFISGHFMAPQHNNYTQHNY